MFDDPYVDENGVLINKLNITNYEELDQAESFMVSAGVIKLMKESFKIRFILDIFTIHKCLFGEVFEWAGEARTITMYKREPILNGSTVDYTPHTYIKKEIRDELIKFQTINWENMSNIEKISAAAKIVQGVWQIHPFREGNTRTTSTFLALLLKQIGFSMNLEFIKENSIHFRNSLVLASIGSLSDFSYLEGIIKDSVSVQNPITKRYENIDGFPIEKYEHNTHTIEKLKSFNFKEFCKLKESQ